MEPRHSLLMNEDDFDYALELKPDDEYRQVAEALPQLVDFEEIDLEDLMPCDEEPPSSSSSAFYLRKRLSSFDERMLQLHTHTQLLSVSPVPSPIDNKKNKHADMLAKDRGSDGGGGSSSLENASSTDDSDNNKHNSSISRPWRISKKEFAYRIGLLEKHRQWTETSARRSSIGFFKHYPHSDKETSDKFLVALAGGIQVRRHQSYKVSELIRLYSVNGCRTIEWERPKRKKIESGVMLPGTVDRVAKSYRDDDVAFDYCIAVCGCCDDVNFGQEGQHSKHQRNGDSDVADRDEAVDTLDSDSIGINGNSGRICCGVSCHNIGFKRYGKFSDLDILAVHPAGKDDPTATGLQGTKGLRQSRDIYSTDLTFSLIIRDSTTTQGFTTLDIECDSVDCYYLLLRGFYLLQEESVIHRNRLKENLTNKSSSTTEHYDIERGEMMLTSGYEGRGAHFLGSSLDYQHFERLFTLWNSTKGYITTAAQSFLHPKKAQEDPVDLLYQPASTMDPFRAFMVGGGLLSTTSHHSISLKKTLKSPPPSHNTHVKVCGEEEGFISPSVKDFASPDSIVYPIDPINNANKNNNSSSSGGSMNMRLPVAQFLGWNSAGTQIWARLKMAGLDVKCILSWDLQRVILKIRCPNWRLEQMAEQMHLKVKSRSGYLKQFKVSRRDTFLHIDANGTVFRSSERQQIIDFIIRSKIKDGGAELDESTELGRHIVQRFPLHMYSKLTDIQHSWVTFWKRENVGIIPEPWSPFTESYVITYKNITESVEFFCLNILNQPLDSIAEYFGENIAFYFAYMSFYTRWLVFPSILGLIVFCIQMQSGQMDHWLCPIFAIIVMIWACFMLAFWRQKASTLAFRWGVLDYEIEETQRPQFRGEYTYDESSGDVRKTYSVWKRVFKYCITMPVLLICITTTLMIMTSVFYSQDVMTNQYFDGEPISYAPTFPSIQSNTLLLSPIINNSSTSIILPSLSDMMTFTSTSKQDPVVIQSQHTLSRLLLPTPSDNYHNSTWSRSISINDMADGEFWAVTFFYPCVYGIVVSVLTCIFQFIAIWLNDFENHRTQTSYMNRLVLKIFSFQFVTIFTSLYYYAFFMNDHEGGYVRIAVTIFSLMTVGQWWSILMDIYVPAAYHKFLLYMMKTGFSKTNRKIYSAKAHVETLRRQEMKRNRKKRKQQSIVIDGNQVGDDNANTIANNDHHHQIESVILNEKLEKRIAYFEQAKSQCWQEALQPEYCNFGDYTNMVIQIGFVLFFSSVFPLCPLLALINNLALIRFNAMKLCCTRKRPIAQKIGGLGVWEDVIQIMSVGGILTNCALFGLTATGARHVLLPSISGAGLAALLFAYEHTILFFKYWLHSSVPAIAPSVQRARSRELKSIDRRASQLNHQHHQQQRQSLDDINQSGHQSDRQSNAAVDRNHQRAEGSLSEYWFELSANPDHYDTAAVIMNGLTNEDDNEAENKAYDDDIDTAIMLLDKNNSTIDIDIITQSCIDSINYEGGHEDLDAPSSEQDEATDETQSLLLPPSLAPNDIISPKIVVDNNRSPMSITIHQQSYNNNANNNSNNSKKNNNISTPCNRNIQHLLSINDDKSNRKMKVRFADDCNSDVSPYHNHQLPRRKSLSPIGKNYNQQVSTYFDDDDYDDDEDDDLSELSEEEDLWEEEEEVSTITPSLLPNEHRQHDRRRASNVSNHSKIHGSRRDEDDDQRKRSMEQSDRVTVKPINGNDNSRRESIVTPFLQWLWPTAVAAAGTASDIHNVDYNNNNKLSNIQGNGNDNSASTAAIDRRLKKSHHSHSITPVKSTPRSILATLATASANKGMGTMSATPATAASPAINPSRLPSISRPSFSGARGGKKLNIVPLGRLTAAKKDLKSTSTIELANNPNNSCTNSTNKQQHRSPMEFQSPFSFVHSLDDFTTTPLSFDASDRDHVQNLNITDDFVSDNHQQQNNENNKYAANSRIVRVSPLQKQRLSPLSQSPKSVMKPFIIQTVVSPPRNQVPNSTPTHASTVEAGAPTVVNTPMPKATSPMMNKGNMERTRVSTSPLHATSAAKRIVNNNNKSSTPVTSPIQSHSNNAASSKKVVTTPSNNSSKQQHQLSTAATGTSNPYQILLHQPEVGTNADLGGGLRISISVSPPRNNQSPRK